MTDRESGIARLVQAMYGRGVEDGDYTFDRWNPMMIAAAEKIEAMRKQIEGLQRTVSLYMASDRLVDQKMLAEARAGLEGDDVGREPPGA